MNAIGSELSVWRRIDNFNISAGDNCPLPWVETTYNGGNYCILANNKGHCYSVFYSTNGINYQQVYSYLKGEVYMQKIHWMAFGLVHIY